MADRIEGIGGISYNSTRVLPVRGYTEKERAAKMEAIEKESEKRLEAIAEKRAYLAKYPTPKGASFKDFLDEAMGKSKILPSDDDEGYVLDIKQ